MNTFTNKVVVITGGNSGIGLATAKEFRMGRKHGDDSRTCPEDAAG